MAIDPADLASIAQAVFDKIQDQADQVYIRLDQSQEPDNTDGESTGGAFMGMYILSWGDFVADPESKIISFYRPGESTDPDKQPVATFLVDDIYRPLWRRRLT